MRIDFKQFRLRQFSAIPLGLAVALLSSSCTTTVVLPEKIALPEVPEYVKVPHPAGFDLADLKAIFYSPLAPKAVLGEFADTCDDDFRKLAKVTNVPAEKKKGAVELVTQDPQKMHWCFYSKIARLQDTIQGDTTWGVRQKKVLEAFEFISPIANAYLTIYHDSRYLRWATQYYSKISEWVFYKKVVPSPEGSLAQIQNARTDLEPWIPLSAKKAEPDSVFEKYGLSLEPTIAGSGEVKGVSPIYKDETRAPASVSKPVPVETEEQPPLPVE